jgi:hypothetical protein
VMTPSTVLVNWQTAWPWRKDIRFVSLVTKGPRDRQIAWNKLLIFNEIMVEEPCAHLGLNILPHICTMCTPGAQHSTSYRLNILPHICTMCTPGAQHSTSYMYHVHTWGSTFYLIYVLRCTPGAQHSTSYYVLRCSTCFRSCICHARWWTYCKIEWAEFTQRYVDTKQEHSSWYRY